MNVCMAQINTLVGDIAGNTQRVLEVSAAQKAVGAHVVVFPELTLISVSSGNTTTCAPTAF